jgi:peptidoglycan hydrolase-like protein with peptidoglycan-binding domain
MHLGLVLGLALDLALDLGGAGGCGHATRTDSTPATATTSPATAPPPAARKLKRTASTENGTPIATGPAGLLRPDALRRIQEKLVSSGKLESAHTSGALDAPTREALRRFQSENQLPATGAPDDATVAKLGLAPAEVFRSADRK